MTYRDNTTPRGSCQVGLEAAPFVFPGATDLAYWAGIFDGEGCVYIVPTAPGGRTTRYPALRVIISNTNEPLIQACKSTFGGSIAHRKGTERHQPCFMWQVETQGARNFLKLLRPYLRIKGRQADIAIAFQEGKARWGGKHLTAGERAVREAQRLLLKSTHSRKGKQEQ